MLTTFYFDKELFEDDAVKNISVVGMTIIENWEKYGCLAICKEHQSDIRNALKNAEIKHQQKWMTAFSSNNFKKKFLVNLREPIVSEYDEIQELGVVFERYGIKTGLIPSELVDGIDKPNHTCAQGRYIEVITPCDFDNSKHFKNSSEISVTDINSEESIDDVWNSRFLNLSKNTKTITIIDRYLAFNLLEDSDSRRKTSIEHLVEKLALNNKDYFIDIYSACDIPNRSVNTTELKKIIIQLKKKPYYSEPNFTFGFSLCKDKLFMNKAHDRMICFDEHVVQIGKGIDIFRDKPVENNSFNIKSKRFTKFGEVYNYLQKNREWKYD